MPYLSFRVYKNSFLNIEILKRWKKEYLNIKKLSNKISLIEPTGSTRQLVLDLATIALKDIGSEIVIGKIGEWLEQGLIWKKQASDHKKSIRGAIKKEFKVNGNEPNE